MKKLILTLCAVLLTMMSFAQPQDVRNTPFYKAYLDVPIVKKASMAYGKLNTEMIEYLLKRTNPADVKYAIINALGTTGNTVEYSEFNSQLVSKYLEDNFNLHNLDKICDVLGISSAMSLAYLDFYSSEYDIEHALRGAKKVDEENFAQEYPSKVTNVVYEMIYAQNVINNNYVGGLAGNPEMVDEMAKMWLTISRGVRQIESALNSDAVEIQEDLREQAKKIIHESIKEYNQEFSVIKIISKSSNPYRVSINGKVLGKTEPYEVYEHLCSPGYYHIKAVQVSGYAFSPTVNNRDVNVEDGETVTVTIGYED